MLGIGFQSFSSEVPNPDGITWYDTDASAVVALLNYASILAGFMSIMAIILLSMALNTLPVELTGKFVTQFSLILSVPEITCMSCLLIYMFSSALQGSLIHGSIFIYGNLGLAASFLFILCYLFFMPILLDREGGLWEEAKIINDQKAEMNEIQSKTFVEGSFECLKRGVTESCL